ncbi:MAG TPA: prepilin peptidase [Streptosporangiaceae bacterium]
MNPADIVTVAAAAMAGLLVGRVASPVVPGSRPAAGRTRWGLVLSTGLAFAVMALLFGPSPPLPAFCYLAGIGVPLAMIDARTRRLPNALTLPSYPVALVLLGLAAVLRPGGGREFLSALLGMALAWGVFLLQVLVYPAGLGWGDVKLAGLLGLYLGWLGISALVAGLFLGYLLAAITGLALIATRRASRKSLLPFGPFLLLGAFVAVLLSGQDGWH